MNCIYFLHVGGDFWTTITFKDISFERNYDYLYIGTGIDTDISKASFTFTGSYDDPDPVHLLGSTVWFRMISDDSVENYGVSIAWHVEGN